MDVKNCRKCRRLFNYVSGPSICPACQQAIEEKFMEVKEFIRNNGTASIEEVLESTGVDKNQLMQWIREERLVFADGSPVSFACENCGETIKTGRFCDKCKSAVASGLMDSIKKPDAPKPSLKNDKDSPKMRFLDR